MRIHSYSRGSGRLLAALIVVFWAFAGPQGYAAVPAETALTSTAEASGFVKTGRYEEVQRLCTAFAQRWPEAVRCTSFGQTPEGRSMLALIVSRSGALDPEQAQARKLPVLLVQGGIHAGEIDGKDAGFWLLRELLEGSLAPGALKQQVLVFVPVFNVDGHERFGRWNRPNQVGPEEMGWRTTAQNLNLNRDYMKADAPEMRAMLRLMNAWDPLVTVDLHVTDGAKFEHDVSIQIEPLYSGDAAQRRSGQMFQKGVLDSLTRAGSLPLGFYPSFVVDDDPASGFEDGVAPPRFSTTYPSLSNRFGVLVETHSWKDYATRVRVTRNAVLAMVELLAQHGGRWLREAGEADVRASRLGGGAVPLDFKASEQARMIEFRGYAYTREPSAISGTLMTRYDDARPQVWHLPLRDDIQPSLTVVAPRSGYLVPAADAAWLGPRLDDHAIRYQRLGAGLSDLELQVFRAESAQPAATSFEGHQMLSLSGGSWNAERRSLGPGALFVPIDQPRARLVMGLLEPQAPDSYLAWGFFNNAFEPKEYMEAYVAEDVARAQLAADPALAQVFAQRLEDPAFARDAQARLAFFARRHPSWDERLNLYPVLRVDTPAAKAAVMAAAASP